MPVVLGKVFDRFVEESPLSVMVRATMENALSPETLDALFERTAERQYTRELLFSSVVDLMTMVVLQVHPAINSAYDEVAHRLPTSITSVYNKLNALEPAVSAALVRHTADVFRPVIREMGGEFPDWLPGYNVKIIDGNHLAATERRLKVLRQSVAGPLPGQSLVVLDPALMQVIEVIPCEDGHAQERSLSDSILGMVQPNDVWIEDRNFCTTRLLFGVASQHAYFVARQHAATLSWRTIGHRKNRGRVEGGMVWEQDVHLSDPADPDRTLHGRRITVVLDKPTRDGDHEIHILSNLPKKDASAKKIAEMYRKRWTLETLFQELTETLCCEINTLGYPKAALFGFCIALMAYNVASVTKAAMRAKHGHEKVEKEVSGYRLANEVSRTHTGMMIAIPKEEWRVFQKLSAKELGKVLTDLAGRIRLTALRRRPRGPKKPVPRRTKYARNKHVSTARLLAQAAGKT
jgi:Transposase DDE domain